MIFAPSPREISLEAAAAIARRPLAIEPVAVFVNPSEALVDEVREMFPRALLQFSGDEPDCEPGRDDESGRDGQFSRSGAGHAHRVALLAAGASGGQHYVPGRGPELWPWRRHGDLGPADAGS